MRIDHDDEKRGALGYPANGSYSIGNARLDGRVQRAYEVKKVLQKALAEHRDPNPSFRGVDYDGLIIRYTQDPVPLAAVAITPQTLPRSTHEASRPGPVPFPFRRQLR